MLKANLTHATEAHKCAYVWIRIHTSTRTVRPQVDRVQFRNLSKLDLAEPNRIRDSIYAHHMLNCCSFLKLKILHTSIYPFDITRCRRRPVCVRVQGVCCLQLVILCHILCYTSCTKLCSVHGQSPVQKNLTRPNRSNVELEWWYDNVWL